MSRADEKYLDPEDGKWGCLGCGGMLYPGGAENDYCANVHCPLRHPYAANADNVRRLVDEVVRLRKQVPPNTGQAPEPKGVKDR